MAQLKRIIFFAFSFILSASLSSGILTGLNLRGELLSQEQEISLIMQELFELINEERKDFGLPTLQFSQDLSLLARKHSKDMALRGEISHFSTSGKDYRDRIIEAGLYFSAIGENVAFSNRPQAELIHEALMDSAGHRKNILDPGFDQVGIGVVFRKNKGYFITQDFRRAMVLKKEKEAKEDIQRDINDLRWENYLPSLSFTKEADDYALKCALNKAKNKAPPPMPGHWRETQFLFITSPTLEGIQSIYRDKVLKKTYTRAGLGVSFGKNSKYPGGCYFITLVLISEN